MSAERGKPAQELPENQVEAVAFNLNEQTGEVTPLVVVAQPEPDPAPKRRGRPRKEQPDAAAQGEGE